MPTPKAPRPIEIKPVVVPKNILLRREVPPFFLDVVVDELELVVFVVIGVVVGVVVVV